MLSQYSSELLYLNCFRKKKLILRCLCAKTSVHMLVPRPQCNITHRTLGGRVLSWHVQDSTPETLIPILVTLSSSVLIILRSKYLKIKSVFSEQKESNEIKRN